MSIKQELSRSSGVDDVFIHLPVIEMKGRGEKKMLLECDGWPNVLQHEQQSSSPSSWIVHPGQIAQFFSILHALPLIFPYRNGHYAQSSHLLTKRRMRCQRMHRAWLGAAMVDRLTTSARGNEGAHAWQRGRICCAEDSRGWFDFSRSHRKVDRMVGGAYGFVTKVFLRWDGNSAHCNDGDGWINEEGFELMKFMRSMEMTTWSLCLVYLLNGV